MDMYGLVSEISTEYLSGPMKLMVPILNKGSVNNVFRVESENDQIIIRINNSRRSLINYRKEAWCMAQAIEHDIPVPRVLRIGHIGDYAYMIQSLVEGDYGESLLFDRSFVWNRLGQYVTLIDSIKVEGFGANLTEPRIGRFDDTWIRYINYNITSLTAADPLIRLGIISTAQSKSAKKLFKHLKDYPVTIGLSHGDVSLRNTIISPERRVYLLDWGSAEVFPFGDILQALKCHITQGNPTWQEYLAFVEGQGMNPAGYRQQEWLIHALLLLRAFDKLRWAIDRNPRNIPSFSAYVAQVLERL